MSNAVELSVASGVADLRLNRPDKMNAVDEGIMTGLHFCLRTHLARKQKLLSDEHFIDN